MYVVQYPNNITNIFVKCKPKKKAKIGIVYLIIYIYLYTVGHKKTCHFIWDHNSHVSWWIFTLLAPMETERNTLSGNYKICNFTTIVSLHYLRKFKNTHNSTF